MEHPGFLERAGPFRLGDLAAATEARLASDSDPDTEITDVKVLSEAGASHVSFFDNPKYLDQFTATKAAACYVAEKLMDRAPETVASLVSGHAYRSFAQALTLFYPGAAHPATAGSEGFGPAETIHPSAEIEPGAIVEPGATVGPEAKIGAATRIAAGAVIGYRVHIGRNCFIGPNVNLTHALIGNDVILHAGVSAGQDGFGFAMGPAGHFKVPQIGRVIIQDGVEIGANSTVDRGALRDTVIGEGTKIDNLVQIGHNVVLGRHCVIVGQAGIAGSTELGDFVVLGGKAGIAGHLKIGAGAQIAGSSHVNCDIPAGEKWGGTPARPARIWFREIASLKRLAERQPGGQKKTR